MDNNCMDFLGYSQEQLEFSPFAYASFPWFIFVLTFSQLKFRIRAPRSMYNTVNRPHGLKKLLSIAVGQGTKMSHRK